MGTWLLKKESSIKHNSYKCQCWGVLKLPRKKIELFSPTYKKAIKTWPWDWIRALQFSVLLSTGCCHMPPLSHGPPVSLDTVSDLYFLWRQPTTGLRLSVTFTHLLLFTFWSPQEKSIATVFFCLNMITLHLLSISPVITHSSGRLTKLTGQFHRSLPSVQNEMPLQRFTSSYMQKVHMGF